MFFCCSSAQNARGFCVTANDKHDVIEQRTNRGCDNFVNLGEQFFHKRQTHDVLRSVRRHYVPTVLGIDDL